MSDIVPPGSHVTTCRICQTTRCDPSAMAAAMAADSVSEDEDEDMEAQSRPTLRERESCNRTRQADAQKDTTVDCKSGPKQDSSKGGKPKSKSSQAKPTQAKAKDLFEKFKMRDRQKPTALEEDEIINTEDARTVPSVQPVLRISRATSVPNSSHANRASQTLIMDAKETPAQGACHGV